MFPLVPKPALPRVLVLPWVITWVLAVPLFHIHALDMQENHSLAQAVLPHTVFSPDLPGEYAARVAVRQNGTPENQHALSSHFPRYSEIALGLFGEDDAKRKNGAKPLFQAYLYLLDRSPLESVSHVMPALTSPPVLLLVFSASLRAPPSVFC